MPAQDADGQRTWRIFFSNYVAIYIRSQPIPNFAPGTPAVPALQTSMPPARVSLTMMPILQRSVDLFTKWQRNLYSTIDASF